MRDLAIFPGALFTQPTLLELSQNYCSHKCAFCFANLNKPDRKSDIKSTLKFIQNIFNPENPAFHTLEAYFIRHHHPVLMSNRSDPFAESNYREAVPLIQTMQSLGISIAFQTRGAASPKAKEAMYEIIDTLKPSCFYISINQLDEDIKNQIEKGSPSIKSRLELLEYLAKKNHHTFIGMNPLTPEWMSFDEAKTLINIAKDLGVKGIYTQMLHLAPLQVKNLTQKEKQDIGQNLINLALKSFDHDARETHRTLMRQVWEYGNSAGIPTTYKGDPYPTTYWQPYHECYKHTVPTLSDLINWLVKEKHELLTFDMWWNFFEPYLPKGKWKIDNFIHSFDKLAGYKYKIPTNMEFKQLFKYIWLDEENTLNPIDHPSFQWLEDEDGNVYGDQNGMKVMYFINPTLSYS